MSANELTPEIAKHITFMTSHSMIQSILTNRGDEMVLQGGVAGVTYYFSNAERFATDFVPTQQDILKARRKTTGVIEVSCFAQCVVPLGLTIRLSSKLKETHFRLSTLVDRDLSERSG